MRYATNTENQQNKSIQKSNTSGVIGVSWDKDRSKWRAQIRVNTKKLHLGYFDDFDDAIRARKDAEIKYFKDFQAK